MNKSEIEANRHQFLKLLRQLSPIHNQFRQSDKVVFFRSLFFCFRVMTSMKTMLTGFVKFAKSTIRCRRFLDSPMCAQAGASLPNNDKGFDNCLDNSTHARTESGGERDGININNVQSQRHAPGAYNK